MAFSFDSLRQSVQKDVVRVFSLLPKEKILLVDPTLLKPFDRVADMTLLRKLSVTKVYQIAELPPKAEFERIAYLIQPELSQCATIIKHCEVDRSNAIKRKRLVIFVPKETTAMTYLLESRGLLGENLCSAGLSFGWISIDTDLITLNLPSLYTDYHLFNDYCWPHFMGTELGRLLQLASNHDLAPIGCQIHALGDAANVVASGLRLYCIRSGLVKSHNSLSHPTGSKKAASSNLKMGFSDTSSLSSSTSLTSDSATNPLMPQSPPLVVIFSRDLDYVTPMLVPMTFEALIHEVIGIDLGVVELPSSALDKETPKKMPLDSSKMRYYKDIRNIHISRVPNLLTSWSSQLQEAQSHIENVINTASSSSSAKETFHQLHNSTNPVNLKTLGLKLGPLLANRRELTFLLACLEQVLDSMTRRERVEDVRAAQILILQSGSGNSLAMPKSNSPPPIDEDRTPERKKSASSGAVTTTTSGGSCGTMASDLMSMPMRLVMEWLSTYHGDRVIDGIRLLSLACVTHDGLGHELYQVMQRAILYAAGQATYPMLHALHRLGLLSPCSSTPPDKSTIRPTIHQPTESLNDSTSVISPTIGPKTNKTLTTAVSRLGLGQRRKSRYNRLHYLLQLSHSGQVNRHFDLPAISPTYVYSGQHCPIVVRLVEAIWANSVCDSPLVNRLIQWSALESGSDSSLKSVGLTTTATKSLATEFDIPAATQLSESLRRLGLSEENAASHGLFNLANPSLAAAGYQVNLPNCRGRLNAPPAKPLPLSRTDQPVIVVFPGGCTYGEVAALRFVAARQKWQLLIATSCLLTSRDLLQQTGQASTSSQSL